MKLVIFAATGGIGRQILGSPPGTAPHPHRMFHLLAEHPANSSLPAGLPAPALAAARQSPAAALQVAGPAII